MSDSLSLKKIICYSPQPTVLLQTNGKKFIIEVANDAYLQLLHTTDNNILEKSLFSTPNFGLSDLNGSTSETLLQLLQTAISSKQPQTLTNQAFTILNIPSNTVHHCFISFYITPILSDADKITEVMLSLIDVTENVTLKKSNEILNKQLCENKNDFEEIENRLRIGRWEIDIINKKMHWSDEVFIICGYEPQSFDPSERHQFSITHPEDIDSAKKTLEDTVQFGIPFSIERRLIKANGEVVHVLSKGKAVKNEQGEVIKIKGFFQDITSQIVQTEEINRIKANQEALINGTDDLIWSVDANMHFLAVNKAFENVMLATKGKLVAEGELFDTSIFCDEIANTWYHYFKVAICGQVVSFQQLLDFKNISVSRYYHFTLTPIFNAANTVTAIACYAKDINKSLQNTLMLESANKKLETVFAASLDIICSIDGQGNFLHVSAASEKIWGYKPEEMVGRNIAAFIHPDDIASTFAEAPKIKALGVLIHFENRYLTKDKAVVHMSWSGSYQAEEDILYCVGRDNTEKKKYENALISTKIDYQNLFDNNPLPMLIWDFETMKIIECNTELTVLYGYTKQPRACTRARIEA